MNAVTEPVVDTSEAVALLSRLLARPETPIGHDSNLLILRKRNDIDPDRVVKVRYIDPERRYPVDGGKKRGADLIGGLVSLWGYQEFAALSYRSDEGKPRVIVVLVALRS